MNAVTLESLRADFDAWNTAYSVRCELGDYRWTVEDWVVDFEVEQDAWKLGYPDQRFPEERRAHLAASILDVAEKHGLEAAMLYRLSDGNIDPRP